MKDLLYGERSSVERTSVCWQASFFEESRESLRRAVGLVIYKLELSSWVTLYIGEVVCAQEACYNLGRRIFRIHSHPCRRDIGVTAGPLKEQPSKPRLI
jgi:hypothetical protein